MQAEIYTKGYWPLPKINSLYTGAKWHKPKILPSSPKPINLQDKKKFPFGKWHQGEKRISVSLPATKLGKICILEAKLGRPLPKKIYLQAGKAQAGKKKIGKRKLLLSRWIGGLYSNASTLRVNEVREFYNAIAPIYEYHVEPERKEQLSTFASLLPKGSHVLDASAGTCIFAHEAKKRGISVTCLDLSEGMLAQRKDKKIKVHTGSAASAKFPGNSFDAIVHLFSNLLSYDSRLFKNFHRMLRNGGTLLYHPVKSPGEQWLPNWREKTLARLKSAGFSQVSLRSLPSRGKKKSLLTFFEAIK